MNTLHIKFMSPNLYPLESGCNSLSNSVMLFYRFSLSELRPEQSPSMLLEIQITLDLSPLLLRRFSQTRNLPELRNYIPWHKESLISWEGACPFVTYFSELIQHLFACSFTTKGENLKLGDFLEKKFPNAKFKF